MRKIEQQRIIFDPRERKRLKTLRFPIIRNANSLDTSRTLSRRPLDGPQCKINFVEKFGTLSNRNAVLPEQIAQGLLLMNVSGQIGNHCEYYREGRLKYCLIMVFINKSAQTHQITHKTMHKVKRP